jgi:hypothetical protein
MRGELKEDVLSYLEGSEWFRERQNKDLGLLTLLKRRHPDLENAIRLGIVSESTMVLILQNYATMDRWWRHLLERKEELRGKDYERKDHLESEAMKDLGYHAPRAIGEGEVVSRQGMLEGNI